MKIILVNLGNVIKENGRYIREENRYLMAYADDGDLLSMQNSYKTLRGAKKAAASAGWEVVAIDEGMAIPAV